jgi:hypothetical protein
MTPPAPGLPALTLDHLGCIADDFDAATAAWERLGFRLCPRSAQRGAVPGREGMHPWATSNRCALFRRGYLELIGTIWPGAFNPWAAFMERGAGLHIIALRCDVADDTHGALAARAPFLQPPVQRERDVDVDGEKRTMRFRNIFSRDADCPEARWILIEHQTPDFLWQPRYLDHPNGALALLSATFVADDPAPVAARLDALGRPAGVEVVDADAFAARHGWRPTRRPGLHALTIGVLDLGYAMALLESRGVPCALGGATVWVGPEHAGGFSLGLLQVQP